MYRFLTTSKPAFNPLAEEIRTELTIDSIVSELGLDSWEARKIPNYRETGEEVGNSFMIRRFNKNPEQEAQFHNEVLNYYTKSRYRTLQYDKGIKWLEPFLMEDLIKIDSVFYVEPGTKLCVTSTMNIEAEVLKGDTVKRYFIFVLSHDGTTRMMGYCDVCPICENTLEMAKAEAFSKAEKNLVINDSKPEKSLEFARSVIDLQHQRFYSETLPRYGAYAELTLESEQIDHIFRTIIRAPLNKSSSGFSETTYDKYTELYKLLKTAPGQHLRGDANGWGVLGAVSNFSKTLGEEGLDQYKNEMFGSGKTMRNKTMQMLNELLPEFAIPVSEPVRQTANI